MQYFAVPVHLLDLFLRFFIGLAIDFEIINDGTVTATDIENVFTYHDGDRSRIISLWQYVES